MEALINEEELEVGGDGGYGLNFVFKVLDGNNWGCEIEESVVSIE